MNPKVISLKKAVTLRKKAKSKRKKWVFTNGCFDILHYGHVSYLKRAKQLGDTLIVGLNKDKSVKRLKGSGRPVVSERYRAELLASLECIDHVVLFGDETPERLIKALSPDILVKGSDWKHGQIVGERHVKSYGGKVRRVRLEPGLSTTSLIRKIKRSKIH